MSFATTQDQIRPGHRVRLTVHSTRLGDDPAAYTRGKVIAVDDSLFGLRLPIEIISATQAGECWLIEGVVIVMSEV